MSKIEHLFKKVTGIDPRTIEPKPTALQLQKWRRAAQSERTPPPELALSRRETVYEFIETNSELGPDWKSEVPYTIISRTLPNGTTEHAFIWGRALEPNEVPIAAQSVSRDEWFELNDNLRL